ncbi:MAG: hypothetical protein MR413_00500 [Clostridia bacterium]|nr:hypothetical protein [Clostridia bacterium]
MKKFIAFLIAAMMTATVCVNAQYSNSELVSTLNSAVSWKEENASPYYNPGSESGDLYITALKQMGMKYDYTRYSDSMQYIMGAYGEGISAAAYSRGILALQACGIDARSFNNRDYVAEGTYHKGNITGVENWSWALIALDSGRYEVPEWAYDTREDMVKYIMANQNEDGSFGSGAASTALAIIALEDYTYDDKIYTYVSDVTGEDRSTTAIEASTLGLEYLSQEQSDWGDYYDLKSTALTLIALDYMDIDAEKDERFIKDGKTVIDGLMEYREGDGGFSNELNGSDSTATTYAICALTSHLRHIQGKGNLFDMLSEDSVDGIKQINNSNANSNNNTNNSGSGNSNSSTGSSSSNSGNTGSPGSTNNSGSGNSNSSTGSSSSNSGNTGSSGSTNNSGSASNATKAPSATKKPTNTMAPITSSKPRIAATAKPKVSSTTRPATTMKPITTALPSAKPTSAPRKKALVGPVEMPGPMMQTPQPTSEPDAKQSKTDLHKTNNGIAGISHSLPIGIAMLAAAALITGAGIAYVVYTSKNVPERKKVKKHNDERYEAKIHRRTEVHGRYKARERYKERGKYKGSYRK